MKSNFSFGLPSQSFTAMGIRFSLKSPAVGSMKRHCPFEALRDTPVKARVAVSSNCCASATALGCNTPPARETGTGVVGLKSGTPEAAGASVVVTWEATAADVATGVVEAAPVAAVVVSNEASVVLIACALVATSVTASVTVTVTVWSSQGGAVAEAMLVSKVTDATSPGFETVEVAEADVAVPSNVKD